MYLVDMTDRLADSSTGEIKIFRDSLVANAVKLCHLSKYRNITAVNKSETVQLLKIVFGPAAVTANHRTKTENNFF